MKLLMVGLLFPLVLLWSSGANAESAQDFLAGCRRIAEAPTSDGKVTLSNDVSEHRCWGAFAVLQAADEVFHLCSHAGEDVCQLAHLG